MLHVCGVTSLEVGKREHIDVAVPRSIQCTDSWNQQVYFYNTESESTRFLGLVGL